MSIVKMKRVGVVGLDDCKEELIRELMDYGMLEVSDQTEKLHDEIWANATVSDQSEEAVSEFKKKTEMAQRALEVIEKYGKLKSGLFAVRRHVNHAKLKEISESTDEAEVLIDEILGHNYGIQRAQENLNRLEQERLTMTPWESYELPLEVKGTERTDITLGTMPVASEIEAAEEIFPSAEYREISADKDNRYVAIITLKEETEECLKALKDLNFNKMALGEYSMTPAINLERIANETEAAQAQLEKHKTDIEGLAKLKNDVENYYDVMNICMDRESVRSKLLKTERTFFIEGWLPERAVESARAIFETNGCYYEFRDPEDGEEVPVLLKNPSFFQPAEAITEMYSLPDYRGFDPTSIYALFYIIFFGIMFSDAGYGLIMAVGCFLIQKFFELEGTTKKMIKLFMYCGVSTAFFGVLFGGFFGDLIGVFSGTFGKGNASFDPVWFNPMDDPITFLAFSLILGVIHLFVGMGIQAYMQIREGKVWDAICDEGFWYFTIVGLGLWLFGGMVNVDTKIGMYLTIFGAAGLLFTGGRHKKGFGKITGGLSNLYSITSWLSDILSYARLLALGLATGVIAQVINTMGAIFGGGIVGLILFVLIFIVGHLINFAINALGAFIHSARLQYVEFFGKFYIDGGEPFKPYSFRTKYIRITEE